MEELWTLLKDLKPKTMGQEQKYAFRCVDIYMVLSLTSKTAQMQEYEFRSVDIYLVLSVIGYDG